MPIAHIKPLLSLIGGDKQFYLLALSQNQVRLFKGSRHSVAEIDPVKDRVRLHHEPQTGDADLLGFTVIQTYLQGGPVYAVEPNQVPGKALLAAVFRY